MTEFHEGGHDWNGEDRRRHREPEYKGGIKFDATINLGHVLTFVGFVVAVIQLAKDAGQTVDAKTIGGLFAALDVTAQDPFAAMERLGLQLVAA